MAGEVYAKFLIDCVVESIEMKLSEERYGSRKEKFRSIEKVVVKQLFN